MNLPLKEATREILEDWPQDLEADWPSVVAGIELGFGKMDRELTPAPGEPVFPARRLILSGRAEGRECLPRLRRDHAGGCARRGVGTGPLSLRRLLHGQSLRGGNVACWRELEKMFSVSVRTFMLLIAAARTGDSSYVRSVGEWARLRDEIEAGRFEIEPAAEIADRWVGQGVLLLNSALTLSRFAIEGDPHQTRGHLPLWRPFVTEILSHLARRGSPIVFIGFGRQAGSALAEAGVGETIGDAPRSRSVACILREHPARGDEVLAPPNPFVLANSYLESMGAAAVSW